MRQLDVLTTVQVAELLGWTLARTKRAAKNGTLPTIGKLPAATGAYLYDRAVIEYIAAERTEVAS